MIVCDPAGGKERERSGVTKKRESVSGRQTCVTVKGESCAAAAINKPRVEKEPSGKITTLSQIASIPGPFPHLFTSLQIKKVFSSQDLSEVLAVKRFADNCSFLSHQTSKVKILSQYWKEARAKALHLAK